MIVHLTSTTSLPSLKPSDPACFAADMTHIASAPLSLGGSFMRKHYMGDSMSILGAGVWCFEESLSLYRALYQYVYSKPAESPS